MSVFRARRVALESGTEDLAAVINSVSATSVAPSLALMLNGTRLCGERDGGEIGQAGASLTASIFAFRGR
jgi:hypothetical protein